MRALQRPPAWQEALGHRLFLALSPRLAEREHPPPPERLAPFEHVEVPRRRGAGALQATWFPPLGKGRGAVLLVPPWVRRGRAYFHRRGRIEALRSAGYGALTLDLPGFGGSGPPAGFFDVEIADALEELSRRAAGSPLLLWGVSAGGYWSHPAAAADPRVRGACFEDVASHLLGWSWRMAPIGRPFYLFFRLALPTAYRFLDLTRHAPSLAGRPVAYVGGGADRGVLAAETERLARLAGGVCRIVPGADHLGAIKLAERQIHELALATFHRADEGGSQPPEPPP
ncbi:MAG: hypothetical protein R3325_16050 [Thermoanaerobaculia bacterium]|nr:hypothetical protein [Thermoanaerobaculia bacterium]